MSDKNEPSARARTCVVWGAANERTWNVAVRAKSADEAEIAVYDVIGKDFWGEGISSKDFIAKLRSVSSAKKITLRVNSIGGIVDDAKAMVNLLAERAANGVEIVGVVDGLAASSASYLLTAASRVEMPANAFQMLHGVRGGIRGTAADIEAHGVLMRRLNEQLAEAYAAAGERRGKKLTKADYLALFDGGDTYLDAEQAIEYGLADAKIESLQVAACLADVGALSGAPELVLAAPYVSRVAAQLEPPARQQELPLNPLPPSGGQQTRTTGKDQSIMDLKVLAKMLGLSETATEAEVTAELNKRLTAQASVTVSGVQLLGVATENEATAKIQDLQRSALQVLGATGKASIAEAMAVVLEWKTKADQTDGLVKQVSQLTEGRRVALRDAAIEKLSREGSLPPARHEWARAQFQTAEAVETFCQGMPKGFFNSITENHTETQATLTDEERNVCRLTGVSPETFLAERKLEQAARNARVGG